MNKFYTPLLFLVLLISIACTEGNSENKSENQPEVVMNINEKTLSSKDTILTKVDTKKYIDFANFIAGFKGDSIGEFHALESTESWSNYQKNIEISWAKTNAKIPVIREWAQHELSQKNSNHSTLFYPFSGADFLHAELFFPNFENFVMIGLEPVGNIPDLISKENEGKLTNYLNSIKHSMHTILGASFFRTIDMAKDFVSSLDGTLHVISHFISRTNHELLYVEKVAILTNGELTNNLNQISDSSYIGNRYFFRKKGEKKVKTLVYFAANIEDKPYHSRSKLFAKGLETRTDLVAYLNSLDLSATYIKSASYLMHRNTFSIIRNLILNKSKLILQDDSGIPFKYFNANQWELTHYGTYDRPISLFQDRFQKDLQDVYGNSNSSIQELPFGIGYKFRKGTSNLMLAKKK